MWKRSKQRYALLGFIGVSCAFAIVFLMAMYKAALIVGIVAMPFDQKTCQAVFDQVRSGTLSADRDGVVKLPSRTAWCTSDGSVYVTRRKTGALMVLFPMWRGKGRNVTGYVFCLGPSCLSPTGSLFLNAFPDGAAPTGEPFEPYDCEFSVEQKLSPTIYRVSYGLD